MAEVKTMMVVPTRRCPECGEAGMLQISADGWDAWQAGALIQDAFPGLLPDTREQLKTGYHPECWTKAFGWMDDED